MRALVLTTGLALYAVLSIALAWVAVPATSANSRAGDPAIVATNMRFSTASRADGSTRVELAWLFPGDTGAAVSPDGRRLAFSSARTGSTEIFVADADAGAGTVNRLTGNPSADDVEPAWSPDGRMLTWASGPPGAHDLFVMNADGGQKQRLVEDAANDVEPVWSPDGAQIAYASNRAGRYGLWVVGSTGGAPTMLVDAPGQMRSPSWSPAGDTIAYTGVVGGNADVWVATLDGSPPERLTATLGFDGRPDWSPDGLRLAFVSNRDGVQRIWLTRADGSRQRALELSESGDDTPDWGVVEETISPAPGSLLPDLDQQAPSGILVSTTAGRTRLGFGQDIDITGLEPGLYVLVHRANPERRIRELRYSNNAASALIRISAPNVLTGALAATLVRRCPTSDTCQAT